jgi:hypothetical protein
MDCLIFRVMPGALLMHANNRICTAASWVPFKCAGPFSGMEGKTRRLMIAYVRYLDTFAKMDGHGSLPSACSSSTGKGFPIIEPRSRERKHGLAEPHVPKDPTFLGLFLVITGNSPAADLGSPGPPRQGVTPLQSRSPRRPGHVRLPHLARQGYQTAACRCRASLWPTAKEPKPGRSTLRSARNSTEPLKSSALRPLEKFATQRQHVGVRCSISAYNGLWGGSSGAQARLKRGTDFDPHAIDVGGAVRWLRSFEQNFRVAKWIVGQG